MKKLRRYSLWMDVGVSGTADGYARRDIDPLLDRLEAAEAALRGMLDLWAREWDHEGGSAIPGEVEAAHEVLAKV